MLPLSLILLLIAAALGAMFAAGHLRGGRPTRPGWLPGALHALLGAAGLATLLLALQGPPRGEALGVGAFGRIAAVLLALAVLLGLAILAARLRARRVPSLVIGVHATIAISGIVILAAYTLVG